MPSLGPLEIVVIAVVALLVFGPNRLPEMGRQVGRAVRELRKFQDSVRDELHGVMNSMDSKPADAGTPPTLPPVVAPGSTSTAAPAPPRQAAPARPGGAQAPSRFRPSATPVAGAAAAATSPATVDPPAPDPAPPAPTAAAHAPSRFRTPKP